MTVETFAPGDRVTFKSFTSMFVPAALWAAIGHRVATIVGPDTTRDLLVDVDGDHFGIDRLFLRHAAPAALAAERLLRVARPDDEITHAETLDACYCDDVLAHRTDAVAADRVVSCGVTPKGPGS